MCHNSHACFLSKVLPISYNPNKGNQNKKKKNESKRREAGFKGEILLKKTPLTNPKSFQMKF